MLLPPGNWLSSSVSAEQPAPLFAFRERLLLGLATSLGPGLLRLLGLLCRYKVFDDDNLHRAESGGKGAIIALWHGRMVLPVYHFRKRGIAALISRSFDGELISRIVARLGYLPRRGSPRAGGREGFMELIRDLKAGRTVAIFPDGPTGPRHSVKDGVLHLARLSGAPIVPVSFQTDRAWRFSSWDRFTLPKPFSQGIMIVGEPLVIPRHLGSEEAIAHAREAIRMALRDAEDEADRRIRSLTGVNF
ncbi:MAG: DUF374 domain-containing protein [Calditrichaeota bacterium]|nr:DUF374 domain-containing protein [Calditrichota bacterium]